MAEIAQLILTVLSNTRNKKLRDSTDHRRKSVLANAVVFRNRFAVNPRQGDPVPGASSNERKKEQVWWIEGVTI